MIARENKDVSFEIHFLLMKAFIFDTETTGFGTKDAPLHEQPYIVEFAGIQIDITPSGQYTEISRYDYFIRPPISIPFSASQVHGIYDTDVSEALPIESHIDHILALMNASDIVVAHNISFDEEMIGYELQRTNKKGEYQPQHRICTMRGSTEHCQLPGRGLGYKAPKLNELHLKLFGERFTGAHRAMTDVEATTRCFTELVGLGVIALPENTVMRLF
jgi:DNA polymerase III subunit epsilon